MKYVLGISGFAGCGKDTLADHLVAEHGFTKLSLADPMKRLCQRIFGFTDEQLWGASQLREGADPRWPFSGTCPHCHRLCTWKEPTYRWFCASCKKTFQRYLTPRLALQTLGTEWGRTLSEDIWVRLAMTEISESEKVLWVIPDVRFLNEMEIIRSQPNGRLIRLTRGEQRFDHPSETEMTTAPDDGFDYLVNNQGTKASLYAAGSHIVEGWLNGR
jgi:hypothetical protein